MHPHALGFRWKSSDNVKNQKPLVQYGYVLNTSVVFATRKLILNAACPKAAPGSPQHPRPSPSSTLIRFCSFPPPVLSGDSWSCRVGWNGYPGEPQLLHPTTALGWDIPQVPTSSRARGSSSASTSPRELCFSSATATSFFLSLPPSVT